MFSDGKLPLHYRIRDGNGRRGWAVGFKSSSRKLLAITTHFVRAVMQCIEPRDVLKMTSSGPPQVSFHLRSLKKIRVVAIHKIRVVAIHDRKQ